MAIVRTTIRTNDLPPATETSTGGEDKIIVLIAGKNQLISLNDFFSKIKSSLVINPEFGAIDVTVNGQTKGNLFRVSSVADKVGVGVENPLSLLHIGGDVRIGGTGAGQQGNLFLSNEIVTIENDSVSVNINNTFAVSCIKTVIDSVTSSVLLLDAPTNVNQVKYIMLSDAHTEKKSGLNFTISTTNILGTSYIKIAKLGDSVTLLSVYSGGEYKWVVVSAIGVTVT